jgi:hypothetical protein
MPARWLCFTLITAVCSAAARAAEITALPDLRGGAVERGIAGVRCENDEAGWFSSSRAAVLDAGVVVRADILLTTAHGLPRDAADVKRKCRILVRGRRLEIAEVFNAGGDLAGPDHDWAVVVLKRRIEGEVHRWRVARAAHEWLARAAADGAPVRMVLRNDDVAQTDCHLEPQISGSSVLLAHSCVGHPGVSGSPLVVGADAVPVLLAIHVGTQMQWQGTKLDFVRVARAIDADVAAAITAAAARAALPMPRPPR